jgi:hypothetical protein
MCRHGVGKDATVDLQWRKYIYILMKVRYKKEQTMVDKKKPLQKNERLSNIKPSKNRGSTQVLQKSK